MRSFRPRALAPRVTLVVALGLALAVLGRYLVSLGHHTSYGWFAYAPLNSSVSPPHADGLRPWARLLIWLGLIAVWASASAWLLRPGKQAQPGDQPAQPGGR